MVELAEIFIDCIDELRKLRVRRDAQFVIDERSNRIVEQVAIFSVAAGQEIG